MVNILFLSILFNSRHSGDTYIGTRTGCQLLPIEQRAILIACLLYMSDAADQRSIGLLFSFSLYHEIIFFLLSLFLAPPNLPYFPIPVLVSEKRKKGKQSKIGSWYTPTLPESTILLFWTASHSFHLETPPFLSHLTCFCSSSSVSVSPPPQCQLIGTGGSGMVNHHLAKEAHCLQ